MKKIMMKNNKKIDFRGLFSNNRFVLLFAITMAFVIWVAISMTASPEEPFTVKDVPVDFNLEGSTPEQLGLQAFGNTEFTVDVTVYGKRYIVSNLKPEDIKVMPDLSYASTSGKNDVTLVARPASNDAEFTISSLSQTKVQVYFDTYKEVSFSLEPDIIAEKVIPNEGYLQESIYTSISNVTVSGPTTEVNKVSKVVARVSLTKPLTTTTTLEAQITPISEYGGVPQYLDVNHGQGKVTLTIKVLKLKELPVTVSFTNEPLAYAASPLPVTISPSRVVVAAEEADIDAMETFSVGTIDFNKIGTIRNTFSFAAGSIKEVTVVDKGVTAFKVVVDARDMKSSAYTVPKSNITILNVPDGFEATALEGIETVTIVGPADSIAALNASGIYAEVDLSDVSLTAGRQKVTARVIVRSFNDCWAYNTYQIPIQVTEKQG